MLHLWGRLSSINVRKTVWAAQETGAPFQRTDAGAAFGIVNTPEYLSMNPNALVPTLQDGALTLWESNVIVRYLATQYPRSGLLPATVNDQFLAEQWMDWQQTTLNGAGRTGFIQWIRTPTEKRRPELIRESNAAMEPLMTLLDQRLSQHAFILGEHFCMADIPLGCEVHRWFGLPQPRPAWRHLERWFAALCARPGSKGVLDLQLT